MPQKQRHFHETATDHAEVSWSKFVANFIELEAPAFHAVVSVLSTVLKAGVVERDVRSNLVQKLAQRASKFFLAVALKKFSASDTRRPTKGPQHTATK